MTTEQIAAAAAAYHANASGPLYVDNSTLKAVAACSTQAMVRYGWGYTDAEERATLNAGSAFHLAMEQHFKGQPAAVALAAFTDAYTAWADQHVLASDRLSSANVTRILTHWLDTHPLASFPFVVNPDLVEIGFSVPLDDDGEFVFCGRIDVGPAEYQNGLYIVEHKSTGKIDAPWLAGFALDPQISGYIWAARQHCKMPVVGAFLNAVQFGKLPSSDQMCRGGYGVKPHGVPYTECGHLHGHSTVVLVTRTPEELERWRKTAISLAREFKKMLANWPMIEMVNLLLMKGMFNGSCKLCSFKDYCKMGRDPAYITAGNLIHQPWKPFEYATIGHHAVTPTS